MAMSYLDYRVKHRQHQNERGEGKPEAPATGRQAGGSSPASSDASTQKASTSKVSSSGSSFLDYKVNNRKKEVKANGYERYGTYTSIPQTQAPAQTQTQQSGIKNRTNAFLMNAAEKLQNQTPSYRPPEANDMTKRLAAEYLRADSPSIGSPDAGFRNTTAGETAAVMKQADQRRQDQQKERQRQEFVNALRNPNARIGGAIRPDVTGSQGNVDQYGRAVSPLAQREEEEYFSKNPIDRAAYMVTAAADPDNPLNDRRKIVAQNYASMTDEEKGVYNYLYATKGPSAAEEYHNGLMDVINQRRGQEYYDQNLRDSSPLMKTAYSFGSGFGSGLEGIANLPNAMLGVENRKAKSPMEYTSGAIRSDENNSLPEQVVYDIASSTGNMAPGMIASALTGTPMLGSAVFAASAGGNAYAEALANGESVNTSQMYAAQQFVDEEVTNWLLGGINAFGGGALRNLLANSPAGQAVSEAVDNVVKSETGRRLVKSLLSYLGDMTGEAQQEYLQFFTENFTKALLGMKDENGNPTQLNTNLLDPDALYAAALGALNAGLLNVPSGAARINQGVRTDVSGAADFAQELAETPREAYTTDAAYESAQELQKLAEEIGQKENATAADRIAYNEAMNEFMQTAQEADAEEEVESQIEAEERAALNEEAVKELSRGFGEEGARAFRDMAPEQAVNSYRDFTAYYNHIRFGTEIPAETRATMTAEQISAAMKAGAADANAAYPQETVRAANKAVNKVSLENVKAGNVDTSGINYNNLTQGQKLRVDYAGALVSKAFGMDVRFVQSKAENGAYKGMNGSFQVINGRPTITLDVNAGMNLESDWTGDLTDIKTMLPVISHEVTHSLEKSNPELYRQLSNAVIQALAGNENYTEGGTINEVIRAERNRMDRMELDADGNRIQHTDSDAIHEIVARACEDFLSGDERAVRVFENVDAETKQTLWDHVKEVFDNIKEFFTQMLKNYKSDSDEAKAIRQNMEEYEKIRGIWQRALNGEEGEMLTAFGDESGEVIRGESGNPVIVENKDGSGVVYSLKTMSDTQAKLAKYLRSKGYSESDVIAATGMVENYADMLIGIASNYAKMQETLNAELTLDVKNGRSVLHSFVTNGEYPVNVDFLTVCKKRVAYMHVLNDLIDDGIFNDVAFQGKAIAAVNDILREKGYETACLGCFVEARRLQIQTWAETICSEWNELVLKKNPDATPFNFGENSNANRLTPDEIVQMTKELSSGGKKNQQGLLNLGTGAVVVKMERLLDKVPTLAHTLSVGDLIKPNGISKLKAHSGELYSLVKSRYGTNSPKIAQNFNPYNSEILDLKYAFMKSDIGKAIPGSSVYKKGINRNDVIRDLKARHADDSSYNPTKAEINAEIEERAIQAYLYDNAGVRLQSFSDFMIENTLDYFQLYADLAAKELPLHAYSKEIVFMKLFGMTGGKGNMSLISTIDDATVAKYGQDYAGLKENPDGTFSYAGWGDYAHHIEMNGQTFVQSIGWKDAIALMLDPRYSAHNGTIAIGISKMQIRKMLDDPLIRMIIPYHASGINPEFADKVGIAAYHNYEPVQTTRVGKIVSSIDGKDHSGILGKDISKLKLGDSFSFNEEMQKAKYKGDARSVCDAYLEWCAKEHTLYSNGKAVAKVTLTPKFEEFADHRNYYKLIEDFNMYDCITEAPAPQGAVTMTFRDENHMLTDQQLKEYEDRLRKTGEFTEADIRKYVAQAQMTMQDIIAQEVKNRKAYNEKQDAVYDETLKEIKDELHKPEYSRETTRPQNSLRNNESMLRTGIAAVDGKTYVNVHETSLNNLERALELGGIVNPSVGIVDVDNPTTHFGAVSVVYPYYAVSPENDPTFAGDAYSNSFPSVAMFTDDEKIDKAFGEGGKFQGILSEEEIEKMKYALADESYSDDTQRTSHQILDNGLSQNKRDLAESIWRTAPEIKKVYDAVKDKYGSYREFANEFVDEFFADKRVYNNKNPENGEWEYSKRSRFFTDYDPEAISESMRNDSFPIATGERINTWEELDTPQRREDLRTRKNFYSYYESKSQRVQYFGDETAIILPDTEKAHEIGEKIEEQTAGMTKLIYYKYESDADGSVSYAARENNQNAQVEAIKSLYGPMDNIRYSMRDSEYMSAVESDDTDTADRLVEEAAKEAGYTVRAYHGTPTGGFTKFVLDNVINGRTFGDGVYFSSSKEAAENFTAVTGRTKGTINRMVYDTYLNLGDNVLTIDYDELRKRYPKSPSLVEYEVRDMIKKQGPEASAIVIKGVRDGLDIKTTDYIVKTSSQIKSAETIVRDDNGDIIPLSERFNSGNDDIRYSQRGVDMSEELAASREQMDERYLARMADVIAEKDAEIEKLKAKMDKAVGAEKEKAKERLEKLRKDKNDRIAYLEKSYKANLDWRIAEMRQRMDQMKNASAEEKQKARERLNKLRAQKDQKIEDILQKNREQRLKRREKKAMQELLRRARRLMGESRKGSLEFKAQVDALIGDLDLAAAGLRDNTRAKLEELRKQVEAQSKLDPDYAKYEAPKYAELLSRIDPSKRHIKDMSIDEITRLTEAIVALEHSKQTADREIREGQGRLFGHYGKLAVEQQKMAKGINYKNELGAQLGKYRLNMLSPVRGFALIDGYQRDGVFSYFGKQLNDGQTKAAQFRMEVEKMFHDIDQNEKLIDDFAKQNIEIETLEGTKKISKGMRIALYLHLQNMDNVKHIAFGGITIPNERLYSQGKYAEAYAAGETVHLSEWIPGALGENVLSEANRKNDANAAAAIRKITDQMTPEEKEYAKIAQEFFNVKTKNAINEVSLELNGYEKAMVDDYFPISTNKNFLASSYDGLMQDGTLEGMGMLKERQSSRLPIYLEDVSQVVLRQKNNTALYYGLAIPIRNFTRFYNYTGGERLERSVKASVGKTWNKAGLDYIDHVLNDLQFGRQTQKTITDRLKSVYAGTTLNFNIGVAIKQSASYPFAASVIGWEPLAKAARHVVSKADREYMDSITPWGYMRRTGFSGTEMGEVAKQRTGIDNNRTIQKVKSTLDLIRRVDVKTTEVLFFAAEEYVKEHYPDLEVRGKAYNQKLAEVYNEVLQRTQPSYDVMQRNEFLRAQNDIAKIFGAFKTQTFNMGGEVLDAWGRWRAYSEYAKTDSSYKKAAKDAGKAFGNTVAATLAAQGMLVILTAAANAVLHKMKDYRDEKGEVTPESVAAKILKDFGTSFAGLTMGGSEVQDFALALLGDGKWYDIDYPGLTLMNDFASASVDFKNAITKAVETGDKKDMQKASVKMAKLLMQMFKLKGVPTQNVYNIANAIYLWGTDIKNGETGTFNAGDGLFGLQDTSPTKQQYAKQAVDAYKRGDIAKGDRAVSRTSKDALKKAMGNGKGTQEDAIMFFQEADLTDEVQRRLWEAAGWKLKNYEKIFHK